MSSKRFLRLTYDLDGDDWYDAGLWYPTGSRCAYVRDDPALGIQAREIAPMLATAPALFDALDKLVDALYVYGVGKSAKKITPFVQAAEAALGKARGK